MDVFDLSAKLTLDKSEYENGLSNAKDKGVNWGAGLATAGKVAGAGVLAVGTAVAGITTGVAKATSELASYGDDIDKSSQKLGVSSKFYQEWEAVLQHSGTSMDSMTATFKKLATASQGATKDQEEAFNSLGLSMEQVSQMSTEELFTSVITGLQGMEEGTERTALATTLLGKGAMEMGALLNTSSEDTQAMIDTVNQLGGVLDDTAIKNSAHFEDSLQDLQTALQGAKNGILADFLPSINDMLDGLIKLFSGDDTGLAQINKGINKFITNLTDALPKVLEVGGSIVKSLAKAIMDNLPQILKAGTDIVMELANELIVNLPAIIETGLDIILSLAEGIADSLPDLIPTIVDVILKIVDTMLNNMDKIIECAIKLIIGLGTGLVKAIPQLVKQIPQIIVSLVKAIINGREQIKDAGVQLIAGLWNGIKQKWEELKTNVKNLANNLVSSVKGVFGIHSPSTVFANIGEMMVAGLEQGSDGMFSDNGLNAKVSANVTGDVETAEMNNNTFKIDYDQLGTSVANALAGFSINMDGRTVAQLLAGNINQQLGVLNARRV